jgi:hypothetical protein
MDNSTYLVGEDRGWDLFGKSELRKGVFFIRNFNEFYIRHYNLTLLSIFRFATKKFHHLDI